MITIAKRGIVGILLGLGMLLIILAYRIDTSIVQAILYEEKCKREGVR